MPGFLISTDAFCYDDADGRPVVVQGGLVVAADDPCVSGHEAFFTAIARRSTDA
jgi:hypothetical protein